MRAVSGKMATWQSCWLPCRSQRPGHHTLRQEGIGPLRSLGIAGQTLAIERAGRCAPPARVVGLPRLALNSQGIAVD